MEHSLSNLLYTPELLVSRERPQFSGLYEVDRSDPIGKSTIGWWLLNEGAGNICHNIINPAAVGTITNAKWVNDTVGSAVHFDGSGDYVDVAAEYNPLARSSLSVSFWFRVLVQNSYDRLVSNGTYDDLEIAPGIGSALLLYIRLAYSWVTIGNYDFPGWNHLVLTADASGVIVYVNGKQTYSNGLAFPGGIDGNLRLGARYSSGTESTAYMADFRCFDRVLDHAEAIRLYCGAMPIRPVIPYFPIFTIGPGGETGALTGAAVAGVTFGAVVASNASLLSSSLAADVQSAAATAVSSVIAAASAADALDALSSRAASITSGGTASDSIGAAVAALADLVAGADAGFGAGGSAAGFADLVAGADAAAAISALAQAAAAFTAGAAAGDAWTAETQAAQIASLSASSDAGAAFLAAAAAYGTLTGAASGDESISATVTALASLSASSTAGATLTGLTSTPQGLLQAGVQADLILSIIAQTSAAIIADAQAGATFVGVSSAEGAASLRGAVTLQAVLRAAPTLSPTLRGKPKVLPH